MRAKDISGRVRLTLKKSVEMKGRELENMSQEVRKSHHQALSQHPILLINVSLFCLADRKKTHLVLKTQGDSKEEKFSKTNVTNFVEYKINAATF